MSPTKIAIVIVLLVLAGGFFISSIGDPVPLVPEATISEEPTPEIQSKPAVLKPAPKPVAVPIPKSPSQPATLQSAVSDENVLARVYETSYKFPAGFYTDTLRTGSGVSDTFSFLFDVEGQLCFRTYAEAEQKFLEANASQPQRKLAGHTENEMFYEFETLEKAPVAIPGSVDQYSYYLRYRTLKCSYISQLDRSFEQGIYAGDLASKKLGELVNFLWYIKNHDMGGAKVLHFVDSDASARFTRSIYETTLVYGDFGLDDKISLFRTDYKIDKATRGISIERTLLKEIKGRHNSGGVVQ